MSLSDVPPDGKYPDGRRDERDAEPGCEGDEVAGHESNQDVAGERHGHDRQHE